MTQQTLQFNPNQSKDKLFKQVIRHTKGRIPPTKEEYMLYKIRKGSKVLSDPSFSDIHDSIHNPDLYYKIKIKSLRSINHKTEIEKIFASTDDNHKILSLLNKYIQDAIDINTEMRSIGGLGMMTKDLATKLAVLKTVIGFSTKKQF